jgi:hypothetical protein
MTDTRPIGVHAGDNKFGLQRCPMCGRGPSNALHTASNFMFRDGRSSIEYRVSALCQDCQDDVFGNFDIEKRDE